MARIIVAVSKNGVIGRADGTIPWREAEDLKNFKKLTCNKNMCPSQTLIVGRKTAESMPRLGGRRVCVATRNPACDVSKMHDIAEVDTYDNLLRKYPDAWVIGGGEIYRMALKDRRVTEAVVTVVPYEAVGEVTFSMLDLLTLFVQVGPVNYLPSITVADAALAVTRYSRRV